MVRVPAVVGLCLSFLLSACALGSGSLTSGIAESQTPSSRVLAGSNSAALGGDPIARPPTALRAPKPATKDVASLDQAPKGSSEKAPRGAFSDRDFGQTALDGEKARELINAYRKTQGLKPLKLNSQLTEAAKNHSRDLSKWDRISHYGSDGSNPWDRVKRVGYNAKIAAENVGTGQASIEEVMKGWQESAGHNKNLLLPEATEMGIALVQDPKTEFKTFWTLVIGSSL